MKWADEMKQVYQVITKLLQGKEYVKIENDPYMPLSIEVIRKSKVKSEEEYIDPSIKEEEEYMDVAMSHFSIQNGDVMRDPEIVFRMYVNTGSVTPISFRNDYIGAYEEICTFDKDGSIENVNIERWQELCELSYMWIKNIQRQWFLSLITK